MTLPDDVKQAIQSGYSTFLKEKSLAPRVGQKQMIAAIARTMGKVKPDINGHRASGSGVCVAEAGTGTGKTVAYLLGTLPIAQSLNKTVVVSTATVALQEQIVYKDLPDLKKHSGLDFDFALAKGRGRYLCLSKLDRLLKDDLEAVFLGADEWDTTINAEDVKLYQKMMSQLADGEWGGDKDDWADELDAGTWARVTTDHRQCTGRRCEFVRQCAFFKARESIVEMGVIVANHDLVLADLALGGGAILSAPEDTIYIFDEGHHLADKALQHFSAHTRVHATMRWLGQTEGQWSNFLAPLEGAVDWVQKATPVEAALKEARNLLEALVPHLKHIDDRIDRNQLFGQSPKFRFPRGVVDVDIEQMAQALVVAFASVHLLFDKLRVDLERMLDSDHSAVPAIDLENAYAALGGWTARAEANVSLWKSFAHTRADSNWPMARWMTVVTFNEMVDYELVSSPVLASQTLEQVLWTRCYGAVVTSATLTALGSFDRFKMCSGTPEEACYEVVPSPFDFAQNAVLRVPSAAIDGNQVDAHTDSIIELLPDLLKQCLATLVLFASRKQMETVFQALPGGCQETVLMQGSISKQRLIQQHKARVDVGQSSVLFGLASFAEGVDLPGRYCEHVIIAKIPFAVPDDPLQAAMAEWIEAGGGNAFMQMSVPDAALKLIQACGRLLRHEQDSGVITLLDRRITSKRYGQAILNSLPPFKRELNA